MEFPYPRTDGRFCVCSKKGKGTLLSSGFACEFPRTRRTDIFCSTELRGPIPRRKEGRKEAGKEGIVCEGKPFERPATSPSGYCGRWTMKPILLRPLMNPCASNFIREHLKIWELTKLLLTLPTFNFLLQVDILTINCQSNLSIYHTTVRRIINLKLRN